MSEANDSGKKLTGGTKKMKKSIRKIVRRTGGRDTGTANDDDIDVSLTSVASDAIDAGAGQDYVFAGMGNDVIIGGSGSDALDGYGGNDRLYADNFIGVADAIAQGNTQTGTGMQGDALSGDAGNDTLIGSTGDDILSGGVGADLLIGGAGSDYLDGGDGTDELQGGAGDDILVGEEEPMRWRLIAANDETAHVWRVAA